MNEVLQKVEKVCPLCEAAGPIIGSHRRCAFVSGVFDANNWNCETANRLRDMVETPIWNEDQHMGVLNFPHYGMFVILSWYKRRGKTDAILINHEDKTGPITLRGAMIMLGLEKINYQVDDVWSLRGDTKHSPLAKSETLSASAPLREESEEGRP